MGLDGLGGDDVLDGGRVGGDPHPRNPDARMSGRRPGHDRPLLLVGVAALGEDVGHVQPPVRPGPLEAGLGHPHLVGRQPPPASHFVRGVVEPPGLDCWQTEPLGEDGLLLWI